MLPLTPPTTRHNGTYSIQHQHAMRVAVPETPIPQYTPTCTTLHNTLGHISYRREKQLDLGLPQPLGKAVTCPICITSKTRRTPRPLPSDIAKRAQHPWQDVSVDLSGKMRTQGITNTYYSIQFVCNYSGAKIVEFVERKSHFIHVYRRFVARIDGVHPRKLRTDKEGEFMSSELKELLEIHFVHHQTCAVDEYYSIGTSENAVGRLRETSIALLLQANLSAKILALRNTTQRLLEQLHQSNQNRPQTHCVRTNPSAQGALIQDSPVRCLLHHLPRSRSMTRKSRPPWYTRHLCGSGHISKDPGVHGHGYDTKQDNCNKATLIL